MVVSRLVLQAWAAPAVPRSPPSTRLLGSPQHNSAGPSPWRHPLQLPLYISAPPCSIFSLCSRLLAAMALASAPCAACSARQGWRSAVEPLPSMGQQLLPRHLPLSSNHGNFALWRLPVLHSPVDSTTPPSTSVEACPTLYNAAPRSRAFPRSPATLVLHGCSM
jgi:hypothetical protein